MNAARWFAAWLALAVECSAQPAPGPEPTEPVSAAVQRLLDELALQREMVRQRDRTIRDLRVRLKEAPPEPAPAEAQRPATSVASALDRSLARQGGSLAPPQQWTVELALAQAYADDGAPVGRVVDVAARVGLARRLQLDLSMPVDDSAAPHGQRRWPRLGVSHAFEGAGWRDELETVVRLGWQRTATPVDGTTRRDDDVDLSLHLSREWAPVVLTGSAGLRQRWSSNESSRDGAPRRTWFAGGGMTLALAPDLATSLGLQLEEASAAPSAQGAPAERVNAWLVLGMDAGLTPDLSVGLGATIRLVGNGPRLVLTAVLPWSF